MQQGSRRNRLLAAWFAAGLVGCQSLSGRLPYLDDPLLVSRKPIQQGVAVADTGSTIPGRPLPPSLPALAFVIPPSTPITPTPRIMAPEVSDHAAEKLLLAQPAVRVKTSSPIEGTLTAQRRLPGGLGHAANYSWLQGILEMDESGAVQLCFADTPTLDTWGGHVTLENDARLLSFRSGDVILVAGALVAVQNRHPCPADRVYPLYHVEKIWLIQRSEP